MCAASYFTAAIPEPYRILGLRLRPLCLGHFFLMARFNVAFASDESRDATLQDLVLGVLICSMSYAAFLEFMEQEDFKTQVNAWGKQVGLGFELPEKVALFNAYMTAAMRQPAVIYEGETTESGAHWAQAVKLTLTSQCGYTPAEAMDLPMEQAFADFYKNAESNGVVRMADDQLSEALNADMEPLEGERTAQRAVPATEEEAA